MSISNIFSTLPYEIVSEIVLPLRQNDLFHISRVSRYFNDFFHEHLPWEYLLVDDSIRLNLRRFSLNKILQDGCNRNYSHFVKFFICSSRFAQNTLITESLEFFAVNNHAVLVKAFIESGRFTKGECIGALHLAIYGAHQEVVDIFIDKSWYTQEFLDMSLCWNANISDHLNFLVTISQKMACSPKVMKALLMSACEKNNVTALEAILNQKYRDPAGVSEASLVAATQGHDAIITAFLNHDLCDEKACDSALQAAAENNHLAVVQLFVDRNRYTHPGLGKAVVAAAQKGHLEIIKYVAPPPTCPQAGKDLALASSARAGHITVVTFFIENNLCQRLAQTDAFEAAAGEGQLEIVRVFLKTDFSTLDSARALKVAAKKGHLPVIQALDPTKHHHLANRTAFIEAVNNNQPAIVQAFIKNNWINKVIITDLIIIPIQKGFHEIVSLFFKSSFFKNLGPLDFYSMLLNAITFRQLLVIKILVKSDHFSKITSEELQEMAKPKNQAESVLSPLVIQAAEQGDVEIIRIFARPQLCSKEDLGKALQIAAGKGNLEVVKILHSHDVGEEIQLGALHSAAENKHQPVIELLLSGLISSNISPSEFYSILLHATAFYQLGVIQTLIKSHHFTNIAPVDLQKLFNLAKDAPHRNIQEAFLKSSRGYELSDFLLVRIVGYLLLRLRRITSLLLSSFQK